MNAMPDRMAFFIFRIASTAFFMAFRQIFDGFNL